MTVVVTHRPAGTLTAAEADAVRALVAEVADDFVPSLARRSSTTQTDLAGGEPRGVDAYVQEMLGQDTLLVTSDGAPVALLSYRPAMLHPLFTDRGPCAYVSTIAVRPDHRRAGHAQRLYDALLRRDVMTSAWVLLRTWSTNTGHLALLTRLGFEVLTTLADDRAPGVDTLYLGRPAP